MHGEGFFYQAFIYLAAAVVAIPLAKRLGLGSVLGYLLAGIAIGPFGLSFLGSESQDIMHFAEFGVVMMLFLVGLELEPALLWRLRRPVLGLGGLQVLLTTGCVAGLGLLSGQTGKVSFAVGMILAMSSTAIVLQTLNEKGLMKTAGGQAAFSVLLFQDIAVIPILALMPLLQSREPSELGSPGHSADTWVSHLPGWAAAGVVLLILAGLILAGHLLVRPAFRVIARTRLRETFTAASLLLVIGIALLMARLGLSPALGTFIAGVVLATSEYRHELESEIEPFKGLLLGLFFIAVGASIDFGLVVQMPGPIAGLVGALILTKLLVLLGLGRAFGLGLDQQLLLAFSLAQGGEFAFVLFSFATKQGVLDGSVANPLIASVALSMALTPLLMNFCERILLPRIGTKEQPDRPHDELHESNPVIVAGYGRFGQIAARLLRAAGIGATLLDIDSDQVELVRRFGNRVYYGDATRHDLLLAAGAQRAKVILVAIDNPAKTLELVHTIKKNFPHLQILARAVSRSDAFDLIEAGVEHVYRETFDSSLRMGTDALRLLGMRAYRAQRAARAFRRRDERFLRETAAQRHDTADLTAFVRRQTKNLERVLQNEYEHKTPDDASWDIEAQQEDAARKDEPSA